MFTRYKKGYRPRRTWHLWLILILSLGIIFFSGFKIYQGTKEYSQGDEVYQKIEAAADHNGDIDFAALKAINPDIKGWLANESLNINYPIVQGEDNSYYLTHLFDKTVNKMGTIYLDYRNKGDFSDKNTIIYGHNMKNGAIFAMLPNYAEEGFYKEHPTIDLSTPEQDYTVALFSGYIVESQKFEAITSFSSDVEFINYTNETIKSSLFHSEVIVKPSDRLVTFYTCTYDYDNARFILTGVLKEK